MTLKFWREQRRTSTGEMVEINLYVNVLLLEKLREIWRT